MRTELQCVYWFNHHITAREPTFVRKYGWLEFPPGQLFRYTNVRTIANSHPFPYFNASRLLHTPNYSTESVYVYTCCSLFIVTRIPMWCTTMPVVWSHRKRSIGNRNGMSFSLRVYARISQRIHRIVKYIYAGCAPLNVSIDIIRSCFLLYYDGTQCDFVSFQNEILPDHCWPFSVGSVGWDYFKNKYGLVIPKDTANIANLALSSEKIKSQFEQPKFYVYLARTWILECESIESINTYSTKDIIW